MANKPLTPGTQRIVDHLQKGKFRELHDVTDLCVEVMQAIVEKEITTGAAREMRQWAELMYTSIQVQQGGDNDISFITNLVQMNINGQQQESPKPIEVVESKPAQLPEPAPEPETYEILDLDAILPKAAAV
jgi:hypothetical protein